MPRPSIPNLCHVALWGQRPNLSYKSHTIWARLSQGRGQKERYAGINRITEAAPVFNGQSSVRMDKSPSRTMALYPLGQPTQMRELEEQTLLKEIRDQLELILRLLKGVMETKRVWVCVRVHTIYVCVCVCVCVGGTGCHGTNSTEPHPPREPQVNSQVLQKRPHHHMRTAA